MTPHKSDMGGWQPIESAPKDGTEILLYCPTSEVFVGIYCAGWGRGWAPRFYDDTPDFIPTHWMPLPDPPSAASSS